MTRVPPRLRGREGNWDESGRTTSREWNQESQEEEEEGRVRGRGRLVGRVTGAGVGREGGSSKLEGRVGEVKIRFTWKS